MSPPDPPVCHLVFAGQLLPGTSPEAAMECLADFFGVTDTAAMRGFLSGREVPLRRNIPAADAYRLYRDLRSRGLLCEVRPVTATAAQTPAVPASPAEDEAEPAPPPDFAFDKLDAAAPPNVFALRPALRDSVRPRSRARTQLRAAFLSGMAMSLLFVAVAIGLRFPQAAPGEAVGALDLATLPAGRLLVMTPEALLLHDRSGVFAGTISAGELGLRRLHPPVSDLGNGRILLNGATEGAGPRLFSCALEERRCDPFAPAALAESAAAISPAPLTGSVFVLGDRGSLWRFTAQGALEATARLESSGRLLASNGLLFAPMANSRLLGVFRSEANRLGEQIDALLLAAQSADSLDEPALVDIAHGPVSNWALLQGAGKWLLARFDQQWGAQQAIPLPPGDAPLRLRTWGDSLLVFSAASPSMLRFAADGRQQAPFESSALTERSQRSVSRQDRERALRMLVIALAVALSGFCALLALLELQRATHPEDRHSALLLNPLPAGVRWLQPPLQRARRLTALGATAGAVLCAACLLLAWHGEWPGLLALLPLTVASVLATRQLRAGLGGHLGIAGQHCIAIDYDGRYFYGDRTQLSAAQLFFFAPGVAVAGSLPPHPAADGRERRRGLAALAALAEHRHPWFRALLILLAGTGMSLGMALLRL